MPELTSSLSVFPFSSRNFKGSATLRIWLLATAAGLVSLQAQEAAPAAAAVKTWEVPVAGNAYLTAGRSGGRSGGMENWKSAESVFSVFFRVDRPAELEIGLKAAVPEGKSRIRAKVQDQVFEKDLEGGGTAVTGLGHVSVRNAGYLRVDLQGLRKTGAVFAAAEALTATATGADAGAVVLDYVKDGGENRFYWGRRGPSVHLGYSMPKDGELEWFYNELTVPEGADPVGSYFMANGFGQGYFGMQVNSETERRVLFSVWSPFSTNNPGEIPEDQKVTVLKKGEDVHGGEFGGEGSGGQSYWLYPWKAGTTCKFLNRVRPDGKGATVYSAWFYLPEKAQWKLIASFRRPKTDTHLGGVHSFLENFSDRQGYLGRQAFYGNQWVCDVRGGWHEITEAHFSGDDIAQRKYRLDYAGGVKDGQFFLRNGGFFAETVTLGSHFTRQPDPGKKPVIDFSKLEGVNEGL